MDYGARTQGDSVRSVTLSPSPEKWKAWEAKHRPLFRRLEEKYGRAGTVPLVFERITGTRAYRSAELPDPPIPSEQIDRLLGPFADLFKKMFPT